MMYRFKNLILFAVCSNCLLITTANLFSSNEEAQRVNGELGRQLILNCNITSISTNATWYKDGSLVNSSISRILTVPENNSLIIEQFKTIDAGTYTCFMDHLNNLTYEVNVRTAIVPFQKSINLVQGDTLNLHCEVKGTPSPKVTWYKGDDLINGTEERVELKLDDHSIENAKLSVKDLDFDDRAVYMCVADNGITSANATIMVRVKDKLAALWPFLGICAEVAILCAIIFIYEKKRVKPDFDESDTDQIPESKNVADKDKVPDVRQRK